MRVWAYAGRPAPKAVAPLKRLLKDEDRSIRDAALATLASIGKEGRAAFIREFKKRPAEIADKLPSTYSLLALPVIAKNIAPITKDKDPAIARATMSLLDELVEADELPRGAKYDRTALQIREETRKREGRKPAKKAKSTKKRAAKKAKKKTALPPASEPWKVVEWAVRESPTIPAGLDAFADVMGAEVPAELLAIPRAEWKEDLERLTAHVEKGLKSKPKDSVNMFTFLVSWPMHHVDVKWNGSSGFSPDDPESHCAPHYDPTPASPRLQVLRAIDHYERKDRPGNEWADSVNCMIVGLLLKEVCQKLWKRLVSATGDVRYVEYGYPDGESLLGEITSAGFNLL